tara:strand:- start:28238 stop:29065 length:828 start_codon:yes stop_codon:yes gene_type:complete
MDLDLKTITEHVYLTAVAAGEAILPYHYRQQDIELEYKPDDSPLTAADKAAHNVIEQQLKNYVVFDGPIPILSEEGDEQSEAEKLSWKTYWCVDPLDGTQEFIRKREEFTVNIALIQNHLPIIGVIYSPVNQEGYMAWRGGGAYQAIAGKMEPITTQRPVENPLRIVASRRHGVHNVQDILDHLKDYKMISRGSALKFCEVACGKADLFLRATQTCEWDNAAGQCIAEEAGARLFHFDFTPVRYNESLSMLTQPLIVVGDPTFDWQSLLSGCIKK